MSRVPISVIVTTFNNERTLPALIESVRWADEILIVDSFSTDATQSIATAAGAKFVQYKFRGYGPQKQLAMDLARYDWVLLLDADERVTKELAQELSDMNARGFTADAYTIPRQEQVYWRMSSLNVRMNRFLRLFDRRKTKMNTIPVHAAPECTGIVATTRHPFQHFGETSIHSKVARVNAYSTGLVGSKKRKSPLLMTLYFPSVFFKSYVLKRGFLNGWAGFIDAMIVAFYGFLKVAKNYEASQFQKHGMSMMPEGAPDHDASAHVPK